MLPLKLEHAHGNMLILLVYVYGNMRVLSHHFLFNADRLVISQLVELRGALDDNILIEL